MKRHAKRKSTGNVRPVRFLPVSRRYYPSFLRLTKVTGLAKLFLEIELFLAVMIVIGTLIVAALRIISVLR